jgi:transcriptional regulator with XRE-family HTH domain
MKLPRLRERRERALLTQQELAARAGVSRSTIASAESGGDLAGRTIRRLAEALDCDPQELMPEP